MRGHHIFTQPLRLNIVKQTGLVTESQENGDNMYKSGNGMVFFLLEDFSTLLIYCCEQIPCQILKERRLL